MNKLKLLLSALLVAASGSVYGQGAKNIVINEVLTGNTNSIIDEYGHRGAWIELANTSFSTYNVRGMYLTTNRQVLDKSLSAPQRISLMSIIPSGEERTSIGARQHLLLFANANPAQGKLYLSLPIDTAKTTWIALYNGNGVELIDSVTVPVLGPDMSYARKGDRWEVMNADKVTPGIENFTKNHAAVSHKEMSKIEKFKQHDPYGFAMSVMAMGIVFLCLALLAIFFSLFGMLMRHIDTAKKVAHKQPIKPITKTVEATVDIAHKTGNLLQEGFDKKGIDMELYMAVIGMALRQYEDDIHDVESGVITIKPKDTDWDDEYAQMTHFHDPVVPSSPISPNIPKTPEIH